MSTECTLKAEKHFVCAFTFWKIIIYRCLKFERRETRRALNVRWITVEAGATVAKEPRKRRRRRRKKNNLWFSFSTNVLLFGYFYIFYFIFFAHSAFFLCFFSIVELATLDKYYTQVYLTYLFIYICVAVMPGVCGIICSVVKW